MTAPDLAVTHQVQIQTPAPIPATSLRLLVASIPDRAEITVVPIEGGTQRDPYTTEYRITATWTTTPVEGGASDV